MRIYKICVIFLCLVLLLFGCQETPEEVQERMNRYGENNQVNTDELKRCTIEQLKMTKKSD